MCDTMAAVGSSTADGTVIFAKNSDREFNEPQYLEQRPAARHPRGSEVRLTYVSIPEVPETYAVLLSKPHWIWGAEIGANDQGLAIGNEAVFSGIEASLEPGIIGMDYLRLALERARDVDEAIHVITRLLAQYGQSGNCGFRRTLTYHNSFILADPQKAAVLETVDREWVVSPIREYCAISNELSVGTEYSSASDTLEARALDAGLMQPDRPLPFSSVYGSPEKTASGRHRRARAMTMLGSSGKGLTITDFFRAMRDHTEGPRPPDRANGPSICMHAREGALGQTTASWVAQLSAQHPVHWVTGTAAPCTGIFKPLVLEAGVPPHGTRPGAAEDNTSLWWRHEKLRAYLNAADERARNEFFRERDALEAQFIGEVAAARARVTAHAGAATNAGAAAGEDRAPDDLLAIVKSCWARGLALENAWLAKAACQ